MSEQARVMLWALPRTLATAFLTCMSGVPESKMFYEPYTTAYLFGPDRPYAGAPLPAEDGELCAADEGTATEGLDTAGSGFEDATCSYSWVKRQLEAPHGGKQLIFCKDMAYCLDRKYEFLPRGYKHIFLTRNPNQVIPSWKKLISEFTGRQVKEFALDELRPPVMPPGSGYGEMLEIYEYVKREGLDPAPVLVDADDLVADPAAVMSSCCERTGVPYTDDILTWEEGAGAADTWAISKNLKATVKHLGSFDNVKTSSSFRKPTESHEGPVKSPHSPDVQRYVDKCMPLYMKLYENRLKF